MRNRLKTFPGSCNDRVDDAPIRRQFAAILVFRKVFEVREMMARWAKVDPEDEVVIDPDS